MSEIVDEPLTLKERELIDKLGQCYELFGQIVGMGHTRDTDLAEAADKIHQLQRMVMAQAAVRVYPDRYRLLGGERDDGAIAAQHERVADALTWAVNPAALRSKMIDVTVTRPDGSTETFTVLREPLAAWGGQ